MKRLANQADKFAKALLMPINPSGIVILGIATVVWGIWVGSPFWDVFTRAPLYSSLDRYPESVIGGVAILTGMATSYGAIKGRPPYTFWGAAVSGWFWFVIAVFYLTGDWKNTGWLISAMLSVYSLYIYLNVKVNYNNH